MRYYDFICVACLWIHLVRLPCEFNLNFLVIPDDTHGYVANFDVPISIFKNAVDELSYVLIGLLMGKVNFRLEIIALWIITGYNFIII